MDKLRYEDYIEQNGSLTYTNVGVSMLPLLRQGKDMFIVSKRDGQRCKVGDVVLYKRPPDQYVLHRIIKVRQNDYVILGDNCVNKEYGIKDEDIIGVMTRYIRNGKEHDISEKKYRFYSFVWLHSIPLRTGCKKVKYRMKNLVRKIVKNEKLKIL
jgi:hypothetical protein